MKQEIWLGDCLELMKNIPDKSVDMILCDLPYGTTACKWDSIIDLNLLWESYNRVISKNGAIILFGMQPFTTKLIYSNISKYKYSWIWKKSKASNFPHAPNMPLKICEDICVFSNGVVGHVSQAKDKRVPYNPQGIREGTTIVKQNPNTSELKYHRDSQSQHKDGYKCKAEGCISKVEAELKWQAVDEICGDGYSGDEEPLYCIYGDEWYLRYPQIPNPKYNHLLKIVESIKAAIQN